MGKQFFGRDTVIDGQQLWAAAFASCFHTEESVEEIYQLLWKIRAQQDLTVKYPVFAENPITPEKKHYAESFVVFYNNLVKLHDAFPGESTKKEVKIYWSKELEEELIPHLFMNKNVNPYDLVFTIIPGEPNTSPLQAPKMDFTHQLQFLGIQTKSAKWNELFDDFEKLAHEVLNIKDFLPNNAMLEEVFGIEFRGNELLMDGSLTTFIIKALPALKRMKDQNKKVDLETLPPNEQQELLKKLSVAP